MALVVDVPGVLEAAGVIERRRDGLWMLNRFRRDELSRKLAGLQRLMTPAAFANGDGSC
jgi:hypothetical protein